MNKTVAVLIAGELYLLPLPAEPVSVDLPVLNDVKAMLAQHSDDAAGVCGAVCVDFSPQGVFKVADDGGNDIPYDVAKAAYDAANDAAVQSHLPKPTRSPNDEPAPQAQPSREKSQPG